MKLKSSQKYYLSSIKPAITIFYIVMLCLSIVSIILNLSLEGSNSSFGGVAAASIIFLFVAGICSFSEEFNMFIQNGITRKELWKGFSVSILIIACIMSVIDLIILFILSLIINTESLVLMITSTYVDNMVLKVINAFFLQIIFYSLALTIGYFIRLIYYRMNKFGRIIVSITVPGFFLIALPILSSFYDMSFLLYFFTDILAPLIDPTKLYGLPMFYLLFILLTIGISLINKQLIRKATIK